MLLVNLRMDAVYVKENMRIRWVCETGIVENIEQIVKEYKQTRNLLVRPLYKYLCKQDVYECVCVCVYMHVCVRASECV